MPRIKKATDASGNVFYPASISKAIYDIDRNQRLSATLGDLETSNKNALNQAVMLMLANFAGLPVKVNNPEWKYLLSDYEDRILFGKNQDNEWTWGDDTDDLFDEVLEQYAEDDTLFSNIYRLSVVVSLIEKIGTLSEVENPEWKWIVLDDEDKVLMGIKQDNSWYLGASISEILDVILDTYAVAGATSGLYADKPTSPNIGQQYFATDLGYPVWYNGTAWVNASGTVQS